jgi:prophage tail gpP-like protein
MSGKAELYVGTQIFGGWQRVSVTRSIEQIANGFDLDVTERWPGQSVRRPIRPGERCMLKLDGQPVVSGYVDDTAPTFNARDHGLSVRGRDATADLVDCSAIFKTGQWRGAKLDRIALDICKPFGILVRVETDVGKAFDSYNIEEGETAFECLDRAARQRAVLLISDGAGSLVIARAGKTRAPSALVEGDNIKEARGNFSWRDRYSDYIVKAQEQASDDFAGESASTPSARAKDSEITRYRPLIVLAETHGAGVTLRDRANWEKTVRMGRGNRATIQVQGWQAAPGKLWQPNTLVTVTADDLWLNSASMLIVGCTYLLDSGGTTTEIEIARPEAFELLPEGVKPSLKKDDAEEWQ